MDRQRIDQDEVARSAAEGFISGLAGGGILDADFVDVWTTANVAADAPGRFKAPEDAVAFRDDLMDHYYNSKLFGMIRGMEASRQRDLDTRENAYLESLAAASDMTPDEMNAALADADAGLTSRLRKAQEDFFYR